MRTTITIDDELLTEAKQIAARTGKTLGAVIEDALREVIARRRAMQPGRVVDLPVFRGGSGLRSGINLDSNSDLLDAMEFDDEPEAGS